MFRLSFAVCCLGAVLLIATAADARTFQLTASPAVPAANGKVDASKDKNGNTEVSLSAEHLAQPGMLTPPASNYIVWFQEEGRQPVNEGQMKVGKDLKGDFKTTTRFHNFKLFITAESDAQASAPSGQTVLSTTVQSAD